MSSTKIDFIFNKNLRQLPVVSMVLGIYQITITIDLFILVLLLRF